MKVNWQIAKAIVFDLMNGFEKEDKKQNKLPLDCFDKIYFQSIATIAVNFDGIDRKLVLPMWLSI